MTESKERRQYWQGVARIATDVLLIPHSKPGTGMICSGSVNTQPTRVGVEVVKDRLGRSNRRVVGKCPICGRVFKFNAPEQQWIVPVKKPLR